ncbi:hypothetical protein IJJ27_00495 [bacterium]|nr:hypothetical protein [bacterium]
MLNKRNFATAITALLGLIISYFGIRGTFALYSYLRTGSNNVQLAQWDVSLDQEGVDDTINIVSGVTNRTYTLNVQSLSEVDINYDIIIDNVPAGVSVALDGGSFQAQVNNVIAFNQVGTIAYNDASKQRVHSLVFQSSTDSAEVSNHTLTIDVLARQVL